MTDFFRFPHTPHLAWLAEGTPRDDKVLSPREQADFLANKLTLEEKIDGANLGFSVGVDGSLRVQNRGSYLIAPYGGQFHQLGNWLVRHEDALFDSLGESLVLFGEWMAARHSLDYAALPDWFVGFDVYDRASGRFWSTRRRNALLAGLSLPVVPQYGQGRMTLASITQQLSSSTSAFRNGPPEGFYLRLEDDDWLLGRAKLVQPEFVQQIGEHWRSRMIEWNRLAY